MDSNTKNRVIHFLVDECEFEPYRQLSDEEITALKEKTEQAQAEKLVGQTDMISTYGEPCFLEDADMIVSAYRSDDLTRLLNILLEPVDDSYVNVTAYFI